MQSSCEEGPGQSALQSVVVSSWWRQAQQEGCRIATAICLLQIFWRQAQSACCRVAAAISLLLVFCLAAGLVSKLQGSYCNLFTWEFVCLQLESESPPALAREDEDLGRKDDGQKQTLEVITEIPEDDKTALGNCQQEVEGSSPVQLLIEGKRIISSMVQTLDQKANSPMLEDSSLPEWNTRVKANFSDEKQADANCVHHVATYFANPTILNETLTAKPSAHNLGKTHLITPLEQDDKEMPKARRSKSVGQFPSTPSKHKVGNGNSKSLPPSKHKSSPLRDMVRKPSKGGKDSSILSDFFLPKGGKAPAARYPLRGAGIRTRQLQGRNLRTLLLVPRISRQMCQ